MGLSRKDMSFMYDNNMNDMNGGFNTVLPPEPPKSVKKKHSAAKVMAMIAAVAVVGGGAGFGGAFLAGRSHSALVDTNSGYSENVSDSGSSDQNSSSALPTLNDMQANAALKHNVNSEAEFNTDGTFMYTRDLVKAVQDSIVYIEVYTDYYGEETLYGSGSGIIISSDGYILTNHHVVEQMSKYVVHVTETDPNGNGAVTDEYEAELIGSDSDTDIAVLKIKPKTELQAAILGNSDQLQLGDGVVVIGNPMGLEKSVSTGVVSGLNRQTSTNERSLSAIQTDAAINSGNSGGAMFNMYGEVVGVVNSKLVNDYAENIGFAITINEAKDVIDDLMTKGYVSGRAILGITCFDVSEYMAMIRGLTPGVCIASIDETLPIAQSGLVEGDTITKVDGTAIATSNDLTTILNKKKPGDTVTVTVVRTNSIGLDKEYDFKVILAEYTGN